MMDADTHASPNARKSTQKGQSKEKRDHTHTRTHTHTHTVISDRRGSWSSKRGTAKENSVFGFDI